MKSLRYLFLLAAGLAAICAVAVVQPADSRTKRQSAPADRGAPASPGVVGEVRIAAVVNDEVISVLDLVSRMKMVMVSSNLPDTPETRQRLAAQVLRAIVDEKLQMQEARRQNISATDEEIKKAEAQIEQQNNMQPGQLDAFLRARGIDKSALVDQLTASIVWSKLVRRLAAQSNEVSDEEIDDALKRLKEHQNEPQSRVAEIFLAVDNPSQDEEVRKLAEKLTNQMRHGARFSAVAQQLSPPIRTGGGYYLMLVLDRRTGNSGSGPTEETLDIVQVVFPLPPNASDAMKRAALAQAEQVRGEAKSCPQMLKIGKERAPQLSSEGHIKISEISPKMRKFVQSLEVGQPSKPILQRNGVGVLMVCGKTAPQAAKELTREDVAEMLLRQRLDGLARRYMRDLRRAAFVDVRVAG